MLTRRQFLGTAAAALGGARRRGVPASWTAPSRPVPTAAQLAWQRDELALFLHFGVNTFTDREWGTGGEDPLVFAPTALDPRQWARLARTAGFRAMILTCKHHDGFCLWPTATTSHSVAASAWRGGHGDVVREFTEACRAEQLKAGVYLSPWDRNSAVYGDSPRYNDMYCEQLTELLTRYGPIAEVWFDGANGEGPSGKRQIYDWPRVWGLVRRLQPSAVIFSDAGPDVRWIGNEDGSAAETNWSTVDPGAVPFPGASGPGVTDMLQHGDPNGSVWRPGECDVSIRPGWFYHPEQDGAVKSVDQLVDLYCTSVGRNAKLLLNVPPTREGLLHSTDSEHLAALRTRLDHLFGADLAAGKRWRWTVRGRSAVSEIALPGAREIAALDLREAITSGQLVSRYHVDAWHDGGWHQIAAGTTIGCRKIDRIEPVTCHRIRVTIDEALDRPHPLQIALHAPA